MEIAAAETKDSAETSPASNSNDGKFPSDPEPNSSQKKSKKDLKNDEKNYDHFIKSLNSTQSAEEKLAAVCKKLSQASDDNKKLRFYIKQSDRRHTLLLKEKEHLQLEFNKTVLIKSKLENLCRELQKQNKAIKEESLLKIRQEEERRKETQAKFQNTLTEITALLQQNNEKNAKLRDDNNSMKEKFKGVVEQYQLREQQIDKMAKQLALESQLVDAQRQKANLEVQAEKERSHAEMEQLKVVVAQYKAKISELQATEIALHKQLAVYTDKYDDFQSAIAKCSQVFGGFKAQMEMMSKKIRKLEEESSSWKKKWEVSQKALLEMCGDRQTNEEKSAATQRQLLHMQSLCRMLQAERTVLINTLKEHNIERPAVPTVPAVPTPPLPPSPTPTQAAAPSSNKNVDNNFAANCAQLHQTLAHLQSKLNVLTTIKNENKDEQPKTDKQKKSKSKKSKGDKQTPKTESESTDLNKTKNSVGESSGNKIRADQAHANVAFAEDIDEKEVENLIQAINIANVNLCNLKEGKGDENGTLSNETNVNVQDEVTESQDADQNNLSEIEKTVNDETSIKSSENCKALDNAPPAKVVSNENSKIIDYKTPDEIVCSEEQKTVVDEPLNEEISNVNNKATDDESPVEIKSSEKCNTVADEVLGKVESNENSKVIDDKTSVEIVSSEKNKIVAAEPPTKVVPHENSKIDIVENASSEKHITVAGEPPVEIVSNGNCNEVVEEPSVKNVSSGNCKVVEEPRDIVSNENGKHVETSLVTETTAQ